MISISSNAGQVSKRFQNAAEVLASRLPNYMNRLLIKQINHIRTRLQYQVNTDGSPMRKNSPSYDAKKKKVVGHTEICFLSGSMYNAMIFELMYKGVGKIGNGLDGIIRFSNSFLPGSAEIYEQMESEMIPNSEKVYELEQKGINFFEISPSEADILARDLNSMVWNDIKGLV